MNHPEAWALFWVPLPTLRGIIRRPVGFFLFLVAFTKALIKANLEVAYTVLFVKREDIHPAFLEYNIAHLHRMELLLLTQCITLTPGTISVEVSEDLKTLTIHALHGQDIKSVKDSIKQELETPMLRFMR